MANQNLIQGAGVAADKFFNPGAGYNAGIAAGKPSDVAMRSLAQQAYNERQDEAELKNFVNSMDTIDVSKVESSMQDEVNAYLIKSRNEYAEAAKNASKLDADDPGYMEAVAKMNEINGAFKSLSTNLDNFKAKREQYYEDTKNNTISDASDVTKLNALYKNNDFDIIIEPGGGFQISHDGAYVPFSSFEEDTEYNYFLRNNEGFNSLMTLTDKANTGATRIEGGLEDNYRYQLKGMFNSMGREDLMSMMYDTVINDVPLVDGEGFDQDLLDPDNEQQLRTWLSDTYLKSLQEVAADAARKKDIKSRPKESIGQRNARKQKVAAMTRFRKIQAAPSIGQVVQGSGGKSIVWMGDPPIATAVRNGALDPTVVIYDESDAQDWLIN